jgi:hypothetical protein
LPEELEIEIFEALLACADFYLQGGVLVEASRLYGELLGPGFPLFVQFGALRGFVTAQPDDAVLFLVDVLASEDPAWIAAACGYARTLEGVWVTDTFGEALVGLDPAAQVPLIAALADRGDPGALDWIMPLTESPDVEVAHAVLPAIGALGNETHVDGLIDALVDEDEDVSSLGKNSLVAMTDAGVDGALLQFLEEEPPETQIALIEILAARRATIAVSQLLELTYEPPGALQAAASKGLGRLGTPEEIPAVFDAYLEMPSEDARANVARAMTEVSRRMPAGPSRMELFSGMYQRANTAATRGGLLMIYRNLGDDALLPVVIGAVDAPDSLERRYAEDALIGWPTATPLDELLALARKAEAGQHKESMLLGAVRMLRLPSDRSEELTLAGIREVLGSSDSADIATQVLAALSELKSTAALDFAEGMMARVGIREEAAIAAESIRHHAYVVTASVNAGDARKAIDKNIKTQWDTGETQIPGQWIEIDMSRPARIGGVVMDASRTREGYPRGYTVYVYNRGGELGSPVATGEGKPGVTNIEFGAVTGQVVRVVQTGSNAETAWSIHEFRIVPK